MFRTRVALALAAAVVTSVSLAACRSHDDDAGGAFVYTGSLDEGDWLRLRNLNGDVRVRPAQPGQLEVTATKRYKGRRPEEVHFVATPVSDGVVVCAIWGSDGECDEDDYRSTRGRDWEYWLNLLMGRRRASVRVEFLVALPPEIRLDVSTVNGDVRIDGARSEIVVNSINGGIHTTRGFGSVKAETVNGTIDVRIDSLPAGADVELESVNGTVRAELPADVDGDVELVTVKGRFSTDFPVTVSGRMDPRHLRARLGTGGRRLMLQTVNGNVELRQRS